MRPADRLARRQAKGEVRFDLRLVGRPGVEGERERQLSGARGFEAQIAGRIAIQQLHPVFVIVLPHADVGGLRDPCLIRPHCKRAEERIILGVPAADDQA